MIYRPQHSRRSVCARIPCAAEILEARLLLSSTQTSAGLVSDDFSGSTLNTDVWTFVDPRGDSRLALTGTHAEISVPAGVSHNLWTNQLWAPRLLQDVADGDFEVEVKYDSALTWHYQIQGIVAQQDAQNLIRFDAYRDSTMTYVSVARIVNGSASAIANLALPLALPPMYVRLARSGTTWTARYSSDGQTWTTVASFQHSLQLSQIGPFVGNHGSPASSSPAHTGSVDYFRSTAVPATGPVAGDDWYSTDEQALLMVAAPGVLGNDSDADGDALSVTSVDTSTTLGVVAMNADGSFSYDPRSAFDSLGTGETATDRFSYTVSDGSGGSDTALVTISITGINDAPIATDDSAATAPDTPVVIDVLANDSDAEGPLDPASVSVIVGADHGTVSVDGATGAITYTPNAGFTGSDSFSYVVQDTAGAASNTALVMITVDPVDGPDITVWYGDEQRFGALGRPQKWVNILGNVTDPDGILSLTYTVNGGSAMPLSIGPDQRRLVRAGDFNVEIDADDLQSGSNLIVLRAVDSTGDETLHNVTVQYTAGNVWPAPYLIDWSTVSRIQSVVQVVDGFWELQPNGVRSAAPGYDRLLNLGDWSWQDYEVTAEVTVHGLPKLPPDDGAAAGVGLILRWKGHTESSPHEPGDQPHSGWSPLGTIAWYRYHSQQRLELTDSHGDTAVYDPSGFRLQNGITYVFRVKVQTLAVGHQYTLTVWEKGQLESSGATLSTLRPLSEPSAGSILLVSHKADVTFGAVQVTSLGATAPVARDDSYSTDEQSLLTVAAPGVLGNDSDADGDALSVTSVDTSSTLGVVAMNADGSFSYDPRSAFDSLGTGETATDRFSYTVSDGSGGSDTALVTISITGINDAPVATDDSAATTPDTPVVIDVLANDTDAEGGLDPASVSVTVGPGHGTVSVDAVTGAVTYTPNAGFTGSDSFSYVVQDTEGAASNTAVVSLQVRSVGIASDDFSGSTLNTDVWTFVDPRGDSQLRLTGTHAEISVPVGVSHDLWTNQLWAPRLLQDVPDEDFEVEVKYDSALTSQYQIQGIVAQQDAQNLIRFDAYRDSSKTYVFVARIVNGSASAIANVAVPLGTPMYFRLSRVGTTWTARYSSDGQTWATAAGFQHSLQLSQIGPFVGNHGSPPSSSPAHTGSIDYFINVGAALQLSSSSLEGSGGRGDLLTPTMLEAAVDEAVAYWSSTELDAQHLQLLTGADVHIADLSGSLLGLAADSGTVWIDRDAAGRGWFTDVSAGAELTTTGGAVDLVHVVIHEFGHLLGLEHHDHDPLMKGTLDVWHTCDGDHPRADGAESHESFEEHGRTESVETATVRGPLWHAAAEHVQRRRAAPAGLSAAYDTVFSDPNHLFDAMLYPIVVADRMARVRRLETDLDLDDALDGLFSSVERRALVREPSGRGNGLKNAFDDEYVLHLLRIAPSRLPD